jgi:hypothetical protein
MYFSLSVSVICHVFHDFATAPHTGFRDPPEVQKYGFTIVNYSFCNHLALVF